MALACYQLHSCVAFTDNEFFRVLTGDCKLLACKAACASHLFGPGFQYVKAVESYLLKQEAMYEFVFLSRNMENSIKLLHNLEKLRSDLV
jgi:hypothetical protein